MPIKNKDGSIYKLNGPNPLMKNQVFWDRSSLIFHNFEWKGITIQDISKGSFEANFQNHSKEEVVEEVIDETPQVNKTTAYCLPAVIREKIDPLYGERQQTIQYGEKFTFELVILKNDFLTFSFWTTVDRIGKGSVVFPLIGDRRWWRVQQIHNQDGGFVADCVMSDFNPDFSVPAK